MSSSLERRARDLLLEAIPAARADLPPGPSDLELTLDDGRRLVAEVKAVRQARVDDLIGRLSTAVLELRTSVQRADAIPVAMVHVPRFGGRSVAPVREFMAGVAPEAGWGLFDDREGYVLVIPALGVDSQQRGGRKPSSAPVAPRRLFTDLQRWLLKLLLLSRSPPADFPTQHPKPLHPSDWAELGAVSHQTAYTLANELEKRGLLARADDGLHLLDPRRLLDEWLHEDALYPAPRVWVRDALRGRYIDEVFAGAPVAVGGFEAASRLGLLHVAGVGIPELHVRGRLDALLAGRGLVEVERRDADYGLIRAAHPESVFRGAQVLDRLPIVDVLQAALDVAGSKVRGSEQAEYLVDRILEWQ